MALIDIEEILLKDQCQYQILKEIYRTVSQLLSRL